jgi:hypothetical protein
MATGKKNADFAGLGRTFINDAHAPIAGNDGKPYPINFHVNPELIQGFERNLFWAGRKYTKKTLMNEALAYYLKHNPLALERSQKPTPDEEPQQ